MNTSDGAVKTQRQMEKERRREQLLTAAARLFAARGFAAVSLDEIGAEVGVTGQAIYRHFESKQDMLGVLIGQASHFLLTRGGEIEAANGDTFERLRLLVDLQTEFALSSSDIIRVQDRDLSSVEEAMQRDIRRMQREFIDIWIRAMQQIHPQETTDQLVVRAHAVFGLINSTGHSFRSLAKRKQTDNFLSYLRYMLPEMAMQALYAAPGETNEEA
ncbi:MAG TPA: TetR/AcrR family transcriptional regulator [Enteractinococcus helveticum]|uniref:TetR/AcrR family transcriptional regulator n=1 Tax=Enteractinococcus helveticum TaxID=1837282 RepID=A0A921K8G0_9MICC|nr:TetR/AcrR family transcriptional regulator [Enteractinococcus helveticum]HJF15533.1 TetR/AcrR family transcriptional regulator [Enteractinococcus helveticum]